ncbi:MAG: hypothetical protein GX126_16700 [Bacteroidales bacterium]|nr:hypothetical protein [Bacteroidales bacterium]
MKQCSCSVPYPLPFASANGFKAMDKARCSASVVQCLIPCRSLQRTDSRQWLRPDEAMQLFSALSLAVCFSERIQGFKGSTCFDLSIME